MMVEKWSIKPRNRITFWLVLSTSNIWPWIITTRKFSFSKKLSTPTSHPWLCPSEHQTVWLCQISWPLSMVWSSISPVQHFHFQRGRKQPFSINRKETSFQHRKQWILRILRPAAEEHHRALAMKGASIWPMKTLTVWIHDTTSLWFQVASSVKYS